jgi:hypothetical protein
VVEVDMVVVAGQAAEIQAQPDEQIAGRLGPLIVPLRHVDEFVHQPHDEAAEQVVHVKN